MPTAWALFNDIEQVAPCFPGATLTSVEGGEFAGTAKVKLGPVSLTYAGTGRFVDRDEETHTAVIEASGRDRRGNGTASALVTARMDSAGDGGTRVVLDTDLRITGRPAQFGRGMIQDVGGRILDQFAACLESRLEGDEGGAGAAPEAGAPSAEAGGVAVTDEAARPPEPPAEPAGAEVPALEDAAPLDAAAGGDASGKPAAAASPGTGGVASEKPAAAASPAASGPSPGVAVPRLRPAEPVGELDLGAVLVPPAVKRWAPTVLAVVVAVIVTRWLSRRR